MRLSRRDFPESFPFGAAASGNGEGRGHARRFGLVHVGHEGHNRTPTNTLFGARKRSPWRI